MNILKRGGNVKCGKFVMTNPSGASEGVWQVNTADLAFEVEVGLTDITMMIICFSTGDRSTAVNEFYADSRKNRYVSKMNDTSTQMNGVIESVGLSENSTYVYMKNGNILLHTKQWVPIILGEWYWVALYDSDFE